MRTPRRRRGRIVGDDPWINERGHLGMPTVTVLPVLLARPWGRRTSRRSTSQRENFLADLLTKPTWRKQFNDRTPRPAADVLRPIWLLEPDWLNKLPRWGQPMRYLYPASHLLRLDGREPVRGLSCPDDDAYSAACDRLECLASYVAVDAVREPSRHVPWMGEFIRSISPSDGAVGNGWEKLQTATRDRRGWPHTGSPCCVSCRGKNAGRPLGDLGALQDDDRWLEDRQCGGEVEPQFRAMVLVGRPWLPPGGPAEQSSRFTRAKPSKRWKGRPLMGRTNSPS